MSIIKALGYDPGFGGNKYSFRDENGEIVNKKLSSILAKASSKAEDMPLFEGERFYLGEIAKHYGGDSIIDIDNYLKLEKAGPLFFWQILQTEGWEPENIGKIVMGLSFSQIQKSKDFLKRMTKFRVNGKTYNFEGKMMMTPQGVGAKYAIEHFYKDLPSAYLIIDIGQNTIDAVDVIGGNVRPENVRGFENEGVVKILRGIQGIIAKKFSEKIALQEANEILTSKEFFFSGETHDLSDEVDNVIKDYTAITISTLKDRFKREFSKYRKIFFVGGGAHYIDTSFSPIVEVPENPEFYNSMGNLIKAEQEN